MSEQQQPQGTGRPFVGIHLKCCNQYVRAYINQTKDAFVGRCPRCGVPVRVPIVEQGGSTDRFFSAS